jgi:SOS-response transcriptional repressor LexA
MNYTPKQLQVLRMVHEYTAEHGYSPTYAELATQLGVTTITVFEHVAALERKGAIRRRRHEARSVEILETNFLREQVTRKVLPVKARLSPNGRVIPEEKPAELLPAELVPWMAETFLLSVQGDGLAPAHILSGDLVLLDYGRDDEYEADRMGMLYSYQAGYDPTAALAVIEAFKRLQGKDPNRLELLFATHPGNTEREDAVKAFLRQQGWSGKYYR